MKTIRYTEEQMAFALRQAELGTPGRRNRPQDGGERTDVLPLGEAVCRDGRGRDPWVEADELRRV